MDRRRPGVRDRGRSPDRVQPPSYPEGVGIILEPTEEQVSAVKKSLLDPNTEHLGFVIESALQEGRRRKELILVTFKYDIVGLVHFHIRQRDHATVIYEIVVDARIRGQGIGLSLLHALSELVKSRGSQRIILKCPVDAEANIFYARTGFTKVTTLRGKKRPLNVWMKTLGRSGFLY